MSPFCLGKCSIRALNMHISKHHISFMLIFIAAIVAIVQQSLRVVQTDQMLKKSHSIEMGVKMLESLQTPNSNIIS